MPDDYELVSKEELEELRKEVAQLKQQPLTDFRSSVTLIEAMDRLAGQVQRLVNIFERANQDLYKEYEQGYHDEATKLGKVIEQNEKIARGVLAVADLVQEQGQYPLKKEQPKKTTPKPQPTKPQKNPDLPREKPSKHDIINEFS